jgi:hypothetical protein
VIEKGIVSILLGNTPLTDPGRIAAQSALLVLLTGPRIFAQAAPQSIGYPYGIIRRLGGDHVHHLLGIAGIANIRIATDFYALNYGDDRAMVEYARRALSGYRGPAGASAKPPAGFFIQGMFPVDSADEYVPPAHFEDIGIQAAGMEFNVWTNE